MSDKPIRSVCVFCGAKNGNDPRWATLARDTGAELAARGLVTVYGGGKAGFHVGYNAVRHI